MSREKIATGRAYEGKVLHGAGVVVTGRTLYTSGLTSRDAEGNIVGKGDIAAQIRQAFTNLGDVLRAAGADYAKVVKYTIYVTDIDAYLREGRNARPFMVDKPGSTLVEVRRLADPDLLVEVEAVAALD
jgi:enamine deaminase RidA (YjgF/YER057c/UK114 family)